MDAAASAAGAPAPFSITTARIGTAVLWLAILSGGFVFREPAPYELALAVVMPLWVVGGLTIPRTLAPLIFLILAFTAGGVLSITQSWVIDDEVIYVAVSGFLALTSVFFAAAVAADPLPRLATIATAQIVAGLATTGLGIVGWLGLSGELFTRYGRASGGFEDPNVFGPFVALSLAFSVMRLIRGGAVGVVVYGAASAVLFVGALLSFSRAAWVLAVIVPLGVFLFAFLNERRGAVRVRFVALAFVATALAAAAVATALSFDGVRDLFLERAQLEQDYDTRAGGRFDRHMTGFAMMAERPLGMGPLEFGKQFGEDEHNIWLKTLTSYGWLGFVSYLTMTLLTLARAAPLLFRDTPLRPYAQALVVAYVAHICIAWVIDVDHWRHVWLMIGLLWGLIAADAALRRGIRPVVGAARITRPAPRAVPTLVVAQGVVARRAAADYSSRGLGA